jgi:hypothetical protein
MNKITPEQALADVKAVRRDRGDSHWFACACALADALEFVQDERAKLQSELRCVKTERDAYEMQCKSLFEQRLEMIEECKNLRAELDALKAPPAAPEPPALSRFLPRLPDDVPAPPDGWVYAGMGLGNRIQPSDISYDISLLGMCKWISGQFGTDTARHYAIRWTAEPDIWHRFGLLAPSEGGGWIPHRQGEAMPCERLCKVLLKGELDDAQFRHHPGEVRYGTEWCWDADTDYDDDNVIGWRPALAEVAT